MSRMRKIGKKGDRHIGLVARQKVQSQSKPINENGKDRGEIGHP
jgi:hypothetical protein